jgi:hypothetical protein
MDAIARANPEDDPGHDREQFHGTPLHARAHLSLTDATHAGSAWFIRSGTDSGGSRAGSVVTWRQAQMVLLPAQGMDAHRPSPGDHTPPRVPYPPI